MNYLRTLIDARPARKGRWLLAGSQETPLMQGVTESMAGRAAVFQLLPLSREETDKVEILKGGFPEVLARPSRRKTWFRSYIQTYLERDVRNVVAVKDLSTFRRFLALLAVRSGRILRKTDLAGPLGVSVPTISSWLNILEVTGQIVLVPPFFQDFGKRLTRSPKLYFLDSGLLCHLLGFETRRELERSPFLGPVFEGFVAAELVKHQVNTGRGKALYFFRDRQGLEVDFLLDLGKGRLALIEAKATRTPTPDSALPMTRLASSIERYETRLFVVHLPAGEETSYTTLRPGVRALPYTRLDEVWE